MELACLGGLRAGTRTGYTLGSIFPSCSISQMSGPLVPNQIDQCFWFGPTKAPAAAVAMYGPNLEACSDNFLVKSICYLSSCIPVSSRAFPDLPSQSINCPFPLVEHTYRKCESLWEGFKTIDVPPELTIICSAEL